MAAACATVALGVAGVAPATAAAWCTCPCPPPPPEKVHCNSGNGNGSESTTTTDHCINGDPGQSWFHNKGGDETSFPGSFENPGGNNSP